MGRNPRENFQELCAQIHRRRACQTQARHALHRAQRPSSCNPSPLSRISSTHSDIEVVLYALVGPLVGLVSLLPIAVLVAAWDLMADWLRVLISRAQSPPCDPPHDGIFDLR